MQNFNLENELKATKQVVSKLKEEVQVYQAELQKLSTDRNDLLNLMGKPVSATFLKLMMTKSRKHGKADNSLLQILSKERKCICELFLFLIMLVFE